MRNKVANMTIFPEGEPPDGRFRSDTNKCVGLSISPEKLYDIRKERLKALGLGDQAIYANIKRIHEDVEHFNKIIDKIGCRVIDVSNKAVEETANIILQFTQNGIRK